MLVGDLDELKSLLEISPSNTKEDKKLTFLLEAASEWIEEYLGRKLKKQSRTEYYRGTGTPYILLRGRPVFTTPTIEVRVDEGGAFGAVSGSYDSSRALTWGDDFTLELDQEDGTSRSGVLVRLKDVWPRPPVRQRGYLATYLGRDPGSVRVTYTGGYTVDTLPSQIRLACNLLVARLRVILPAGMEISSESYEERSVGLMARQKDYLLGMVKPMLWPFLNRKW